MARHPHRTQPESQHCAVLRSLLRPSCSWSHSSTSHASVNRRATATRDPARSCRDWTSAVPSHLQVALTYRLTDMAVRGEELSTCNLHHEVVIICRRPQIDELRRRMRKYPGMQRHGRRCSPTKRAREKRRALAIVWKFALQSFTQREQPYLSSDYIHQ
jgi:hypothetical protein